MRKWIAALAVFLAVQGLGLWPFPQTDAGELYIVETLLIETRGSEVLLRTEEASGRGSTVGEALKDLAEQVPGELFLRQTRRVIFCGGAEETGLSQMPEELPMGTILYRWSGRGEALDLARMNKVLEARERRESPPDLARQLNQMAQGDPAELPKLEWRNTDG